MPKTQSCEILVIGGGIVGLASACAMALKGFKVLLVDGGSLSSTPSDHKSERVYALNHASIDCLQQLGVLSLLSEQSLTPYNGMRIWQHDDTKTTLSFDARDVAKTCLGYMMKASHLKPALIQRALDLGVALKGSTSIISCQSQGSWFESIDADQNCIRTKLALICDGPRSTIREMLEVPVTTWSYQHDALVATVNCEKPHQRLAYQVFHPKGPLAFLPLQDPYECSIVWSFPPEDIQQLMHQSPQAFEVSLGQAFSTLGRIKLKHKRYSYPLYMRHAKQYVGSNWMILGDAAHTIHPLAGLGLNLGLADVATWFELCCDTNLTRALKHYERKRRYEVWSIIVLMQGIKALFSFENKPLCFLRRQGMHWLNQLTPIKRELIHFASGVDK